MARTKSRKPGGKKSGKAPVASDWQSLFHQHLEVLNEHLELWSSIQTQQSEGSPGFLAAQICKAHAQDMKRGAEDFMSSNHFSSRPQTTDAPEDSSHGMTSPIAPKSGLPIITVNESLPRQLKRRRVEDSTQTQDHINSESIQDYSKLFSIDSNPTPLEDLMSQSLKNQQKSKKREKQNVSRMGMQPLGLSEEDLKPERQLEPKLKGTLPEQEKSNKDDDSFLSKVEKKHKEKEDRRKRKLEKKRKRESNASVESSDALKDDDSGKSKRKKKKQKQKNDGEAESTEAGQTNLDETTLKKREAPSHEQRPKRQKTK